MAPRFSIKRLEPGRYLVNDRYELNRTRTSMIGASEKAWYWRDGSDPVQRPTTIWSGLLNTRAEAITSLRAHLEALENQK